MWHRAPDCAGGRVGPWSPPCLENCPLATRAACTTIELVLGLLGREPPPRDHRQGRGVYSFREGETRPYDHVGEGLEHAGPVSPILFAPSDRPAARVREASWQTFAGHDGTLGYYGRVRGPDYDQCRVHIVFCILYLYFGRVQRDQITTSQCTLYFVSGEAGCIVSNILGLEKKIVQCLWK